MLNRRSTLILPLAIVFQALAISGEAAPTLDQRVNDAVKNGKEFLLARADGKGFFDGKFKENIGSTALVVCALRKCGVPRDHDAIKKAVVRIYEYADSPLAADYKLTYDAGICLLALDAISQAPDPNYAPTVEPRTKVAAAKLALALMTYRGNRGGWWYVGKTDGDMSTSQYGALGLWAASRLGIPVQPPFWDSVAGYVIKVHQKTDGGFSYHDQVKPGEKSKPSITAAAIGTLALALRQSTKKQMEREIVIDDYDKDKKVEKKTVEVEVKKAKTEVEKAIERGFGWWLGASYEHKDAYYWYATERACTLTGTKLLGKLPWYDVLAEQILKEQKQEGSWINGQDATCDTSWALLALTRATGQMIQEKEDYDYTGKNTKPSVKAPAKPEPPKTTPPAAEKKPDAPEKKPAAEKKPGTPGDE